MGERVRVGRAIAAALILVAIVGVAILARPYAGTALDRLTANPPPVAPTFTPDPDVCRIQAREAAASPDRHQHGTTPAFLIGDSWANGAGIQPAYPELLARELGLDLRVSAIGGTGYLNPGGCLGMEFVTRAWQIPVNTELVILAGGVNDGYHDASFLKAAIEEMVTAAHTRAPDARVVILGTPRVLLLGDEVTGPVDDVLRSVAGDSFIDVRGWDISLLPDRIHPDKAGQREYAERIAAAMR